MAGLALFLILVGISLFFLLTRRERYRPQPPAATTPASMLPTAEIHMDPVTGLLQRVWIDPATGYRTFVDEPGATPSVYPPLNRPGLPAVAPNPYQPGSATAPVGLVQSGWPPVVPQPPEPPPRA